MSLLWTCRSSWHRPPRTLYVQQAVTCCICSDAGQSAADLPGLLTAEAGSLDEVARPEGSRAAAGRRGSPGSRAAAYRAASTIAHIRVFCALADSRKLSDFTWYMQTVGRYLLVSHIRKVQTHGCIATPRMTTAAMSAVEKVGVWDSLVSMCAPLAAACRALGSQGAAGRLGKRREVDRNQGAGGTRPAAALRQVPLT